MTDLLKAEVIEALAKELENGEFFHDGLSADLMETADKANAYVEGYRATADVIRSFNLTPFQLKVPEDIRSVLRNVDCQCKLVERESGHRTDCWRPELDSLIESLSAQLAERDREIAELRADIDAALSLGDQLADWINKVAPCAQSMMDAYERRIRSLCETPEEIAKSPWECAEFVALRNVLLRKPVAVVEVQTIKDRIDG